MSTFLATDRCDRCGAQAYVRTAHPIDGRFVEMLWCGHHAHEHRAVLLDFTVDDERASLVTTSAPYLG